MLDTITDAATAQVHRMRDALKAVLRNGPTVETINQAGDALGWGEVEAHGDAHPEGQRQSLKSFP